MKHTIRTARNILAVMLAVLLTALTASVAFATEDIDVNVRFVNTYATGSIDPATDLTNYAEKTEKVLTVPQGTTVYLKAEGAPEDAVVYEEEPVRRKDADFGAFTFIGWAESAEEGAAIVGDSIEANTDLTLYAAFEGVPDVEYTIDFRSDGVYVDADGNLQPEVIQVPLIDENTGLQKTDPYSGEPLFVAQLNDVPRPAFTVKHGKGVELPSSNPTREDSGHYEFHFKEWDYDNTKIYKSGSINAVYDMVGKTYKFRFLDYDGTELGKRDIVYGTACGNVPAVKNQQFSTNERQYSFHGDWNLVQDGLQNGTGEMIDMDNVQFLDAVEDEEHYINVYAQYWQQLNEYFFTLHIIYSDNDPAEGVGVQVQGPENQLLNTFRDESLGHNGGVGTTDKDGLVTLSVPYSEYYIISAYDPYYNLAVQQKLTLENIRDNAQITMQLEEPYELNNGQQRCNDVCHSFLGGLWITGLNLFYRLFKVKYVCCYDMYATHGDRLAYTSGSSGRTIDRS